MADIAYTVRKVVLPVALLEETKTLLKHKGCSEVGAHHIIDLCLEKLDSFSSLAVRVSDISGYRNFLNTVFSGRAAKIIFYLNARSWDRFLAVQNAYNIGVGDIVRLILGSYLFPSGQISFSLRELSELFISEKRAYKFNLVLTKPVAAFLSETGKKILPINREVIIRAAHHYFSKGMRERERPFQKERYHIDNTTVGWTRLTVTGSLAMRDYFQREKESTGKTLGIVMAHTIYSFLEDLREVNHDE